MSTEPTPEERIIKLLTTATFEESGYGKRIHMDDCTFYWSWQVVDHLRGILNVGPVKRS